MVHAPPQCVCISDLILWMQMLKCHPMTVSQIHESYVPPTKHVSNLHSPICPCALHMDCMESKWVHVHSAQTVQSPSLCRLCILCIVCTKIAQQRNQTIAEPIVAAGLTFYHCAIVAYYIQTTCAICVTCGLIGKYVYFYSIWDIWYMSWTSFLVWIQSWCPFCDWTNHIW